MAKLYEIVTVEEHKPFTQRKREGLERRNSNRLSMVNYYVLQVEKLWENYALTRSEIAQDKLLKHLTEILRNKARAWGRRWNNCKLSAADFESVFFEEAWKLSDSYIHYGDFYFYETLILALERRAIDVVRKQTRTKRGTFEVEIRRLKEETADYLADININVEGNVIDRCVVTQMLNDDTLTEQEQQLLLAKYEYPNASMIELARGVRLKHHEEVRRTFNRISKKMSHYDL